MNARERKIFFGLLLGVMSICGAVLFLSLPPADRATTSEGTRPGVPPTEQQKTAVVSKPQNRKRNEPQAVMHNPTAAPAMQKALSTRDGMAAPPPSREPAPVHDVGISRPATTQERLAAAQVLPEVTKEAYQEEIVQMNRAIEGAQADATDLDGKLVELEDAVRAAEEAYREAQHDFQVGAIDKQQLDLAQEEIVRRQSNVDSTINMRDSKAIAVERYRNRINELHSMLGEN